MNVRPPRLTMITDGDDDPERIAAAVEAALEGGVEAVQVRRPRATALEVARLCARLAPAVRAAGARLFVNDRADIAAAGLCDGVQLGRRALPVELVRRFLPDAPLGVSAHDPDELAQAARGGADFALLSPVFPTASKPGQPGLGIARAAAWTAAAALPVLWLGGVTAGRLDAARRAGLRAPPHLAGVAALSVFADPRTARANARALGEPLVAILGPT